MFDIAAPGLKELCEFNFAYGYRLLWQPLLVTSLPGAFSHPTAALCHPYGPDAVRILHRQIPA
jgi:hypothetical protein